MAHNENSVSSRKTRTSCELDEWLTSITIHEATSQLEERPQQKPKIQKVPLMLRKIKANEKCYEPLVVSLGPFHHGNPELDQMEKLKNVMACRFVMENKKPIKEMFTSVKAVSDKAKECYDDEVLNGLPDMDFAKMMFLDGCFILQFIYMFTSDETAIKAVMKSNDVAFVHRDLFLLENQVPFVVLDALMGLRFTVDEWREMFLKFIQSTQASPPETRRYLNEIMRIFSNLRFFRGKQALPGEFYTYSYKRMRKFNNLGDVLHPTTGGQDFKDYESIHLLDLARFLLIGESNSDKGQKKADSDWSSYRSAKELKTVGIHFHPSGTQTFTDVSFQSNLLSGTLCLPPLTVDDSTKSMLLNMVAYETCPDAPDDFAVTSYICLMDTLIDHADDVMVLRSKGIILNLLGSDQQVADLFNEIANDLVPNPNAYFSVKKKIEKHYKNKLNMWIAQWLHTHFSSPWTVFGLLAAIFVIGLTVTQTYFTIFPRDNVAGKHP